MQVHTDSSRDSNPRRNGYGLTLNASADYVSSLLWANHCSRCRALQRTTDNRFWKKTCYLYSIKHSIYRNCAKDLFIGAPKQIIITCNGSQSGLKLRSSKNPVCLFASCKLSIGLNALYTSDTTPVCFSASCKSPACLFDSCKTQYTSLTHANANRSSCLMHNLSLLICLM